MNLAIDTPALPLRSTQTRTLVQILDFSCADGHSGLAWRLRRVSGVRGVTFDPWGDAVLVTFDPAQTNLAELDFVVAAAGYRQVRACGPDCAASPDPRRNDTRDGQRGWDSTWSCQ